jgi:cellobiose phosphorylase
MDLKEIRGDMLDSIHQVQAGAKKQALDMVMNHWIAQNLREFLD